MVAFIDESGDRGLKRTATPHFILAAAMMPESRRPEAAEWLASLRKDFNRGPQHELSWKRYTRHDQRLHVAEKLGQQRFARLAAVVTCKRHLPLSSGFDADRAYMFSFRLLLERMSWLARERDLDLHYTLGHIKGFPTSKLREYEARLRTVSTSIKWSHVADEQSAIARPDTEELIQMADALASSVGAAFNPDRYGRTEQRYINSYAHRFYRGEDDRGVLTSLGLKMHPWRSNRADHPWVTAL